MVAIAREPDPTFVEAAHAWRAFYATHPPFFADKCPDGKWRVFGWSAPDEDAACAIFTTRQPRNESNAKEIARQMCREMGQ